VSGCGDWLHLRHRTRTGSTRRLLGSQPTPGVGNPAKPCQPTLAVFSNPLWGTPNPPPRENSRPWAHAGVVGALAVKATPHRVWESSSSPLSLLWYVLKGVTRLTIERSAERLKCIEIQALEASTHWLKLPQVLRLLRPASRGRAQLAGRCAVAVVQRHLGHASASTTLNWYGALLPSTADCGHWRAKVAEPSRGGAIGGP
jgi:hypothetical protein